MKYSLGERERELECLVVKSLTREIQLLLLAPNEYASSLYKNVLKATKNFIPKIYYIFLASVIAQQS